MAKTSRALQAVDDFESLAATHLESMKRESNGAKPGWTPQMSSETDLICQIVLAWWRKSGRHY